MHTTSGSASPTSVGGAAASDEAAIGACHASAPRPDLA